MSDTNVHRVVGNLLVGTSHFFVDTTTNQVGINTSSPSASLDVATGDVKVGSSITLASSSGIITATGGFSGDGSGLSGVNSDSGSWVKDDTNGLIYVANLAHKVGIGKDNPSYMLDVNGDINIPDGSTLRVGGTPAVFSNWSVNGSDISRSSGNVGIGGAASGTNRLKVHGTVEASSFSGILATDVPTLDTSKISGLGTFATKNDGNYNIHNPWLREYGDNAHFKIYGGTRQVAFRTDGTSEYAGGIGGYPFTWMYGGDASSNRRMLLNTSGQLWCSDYGWLHDKFANRGGDSAVDFYADRVYSDDWFRAQGNCGIYWQNHGGGWHMTDSTWVRIYNGKSLWGGNGTIATDGKMGVGTSNPIAKLHINGSGSFTINLGYMSYFNYYDSYLLWSNYNNWTGGGSIYATSHICTQGYFVTGQGSISASDSRIKKEIVDVEDGAALEILRLLKPKKYKYVDEVQRGSEPVWGFIAQEVRDTLPHATHLITECIPNIYEVANVSASNVITLTNFDTSTLDSNAVLKVFDKDDKEHLVTITDIVDEHSIRVDEDLSELTGSIDESGNAVAGNQLFVYGQQVDDFVFLKKDSIYTVATAALQEVDRQLQTTRTELTEERTLHETTRTQLRTTQTELDIAKIKLLNIEARMQIIESNISKVVV